VGTPPSRGREAAILKRCSAFAAQQLALFRNYPEYPEILQQLEAIPNSIFEQDVEHAVAEVTKKQKSTP
jgi:hypothetical protein